MKTSKNEKYTSSRGRLIESLGEGAVSHLNHRVYGPWFLLDNGAPLSKIFPARHTDQIVAWIQSRKYLDPLIEHLNGVFRFLRFDSKKLEDYRSVMKALVDLPREVLSQKSLEIFDMILQKYPHYFSINLSKDEKILLYIIN